MRIDATSVMTLIEIDFIPAYIQPRIKYECGGHLLLQDSFLIPGLNYQELRLEGQWPKEIVEPSVL